MNVPATRSLGHCKAKISIAGIVVEKIPVQVVPDDAQCVDLFVGRTFTDLPFVTYAKVGSTFRFYHLNDCPFADLAPLEQKSNLKNLERRFVNDHWTKRIPPNRPVTDDTTLQGFVTLEKEYLRARPLNMPGIRLKLSRNAIHLSLSHKFCLRTPTASVSYVIKREADLEQPPAS
ncbi:hypothetical protein HPB52_009988 [Rhipicephalus sanguineus]|uniref:Uncharacterized protein n=1 Tax=Rhipicephalus sanguineus TaxID=34632 RepID=A0A9D4SNR4_RHISA|nr:hypothetical protein HPB52_009988 [Rhipicephalus sanguineus]